MKRIHKLRSRMAAAQMHALTAVRREIRSRDFASGSKYLREFNHSFRKYDRVLSSNEFDEQIAAASILLVGDYHSLAASQHFAASLLERVAQRSPVVLAVEAVLSRDQQILHSWWRRQIEEQEFRERIRFDREWGYDWAPFYKLLLSARDHSEGAYGIDSTPRDDLRSIRSRDRHAAAKICEIRHQHPDATILVLFGESHMAPQHLPAILRKVLPAERLLTILQNLDFVYWNALGQRAAAVGITEDTVCVFNSSPLEKYESYRFCLEKWNAAPDDPPDYAPAVYNLIFSLARTLGFRQNSPHNGTQPKFLADSLPEVVTVEGKAEEVFASTELATQFAGPGQLRRRIQHVRSKLTMRLEKQGCVYVAAANRIYVREFRLPHVAAEAARFLHFACTLGTHAEPRQTPKLDDALAHLGSRLLCPNGSEKCYQQGESLYRDYVEGRINKAAMRRMFLGRS